MRMTLRTIIARLNQNRNDFTIIIFLVVAAQARAHAHTRSFLSYLLFFILGECDKATALAVTVVVTIFRFSVEIETVLNGVAK